VAVTTIYMPLLDEGVDAWAPIKAQTLEDGLFRILGPMPTDQAWAFAPGALVRGERRLFGDGTEAVAATALAQ
jgi:hypothetical protein